MEKMRTPNAGRVASALLALAAAVVLCSWQCRPRSEKDAVAAVLDDLAQRVEDRDAEGLVSHLAADYRDHEERDREATRAMAEEYFRRYRGIKAKLLSSRIEMKEAGTAAVETDVSLYSGVASALRKAVGFSGENYRVSCVFRKNGAWRVSQARWEYIPLESLFPESLKILRELFSDV